MSEVAIDAGALAFGHTHLPSRHRRVQVELDFKTASVIAALGGHDGLAD